MKAIAIGCGALLMVFALGAFLLMRKPLVLAVPSGTLPEIALVVAGTSAQGFELSATLSADAEGFVISEITAPRTCARLLGLGPAPGFREEPFPLEPSEQGDPSAQAFAKKFDQELVRWAGQAAVKLGAGTLIQIPAAHPDAGSCQLSVHYERRGRLGGMSAMAKVTLGKGP